MTASTVARISGGLFTHCTKTVPALEQIVLRREILSPALLPASSRFSPFADDFAGRSRYVMLAPALGYLNRSRALVAGLVFTTDVLTLAGAKVHTQPLVFSFCVEIVRLVRATQRSAWREFFLRDSPRLGQFNRPGLAVTFRDYMTWFLSHDSDELVYGDAWGPSAFSEGVLRLLYLENRALRAVLDRTWSELRASLEVDACNWSTDVGSSSNERDLERSGASEMQVLVPDRLALTNPAFAGLAVRWDTRDEVMRTLQTHRAELSRDDPSWVLFELIQDDVVVHSSLLEYLKDKIDYRTFPRRGNAR